MNREVTEGDIDALGYVMSTLTDVRKKESEIDLELEPIKKNVFDSRYIFSAIHDGQGRARPTVAPPVELGEALGGVSAAPG
jgi:hypothetical protein